MTRQVPNETFPIVLNVGQEKFGTVTSSFYRNVTAVLILFDVSRKEGFERLASWIDEIGRFSISDYIIVAHKCDLEPAISKVFPVSRN